MNGGNDNSSAVAQSGPGPNAVRLLLLPDEPQGDQGQKADYEVVVFKPLAECQTVIEVVRHAVTYKVTVS